MISLGDVAQLITALVLLATFIQSYFNGLKLNVVKAQTDGINKQLVKVTGEAEYAKGVKKGENK